MNDPLSQFVACLHPSAVSTKHISAAGRWANRYANFREPTFSTVLEGRCRLEVDGKSTITLEAGDFTLLLAKSDLVLSGLDPMTPRPADPKAIPAANEELRHGDRNGPPSLRLLGGIFTFESADSSFLVSLLPPVINIRAATQLSMLTTILNEETREQRPGRDLALNHLIELLLVGALREVTNNVPSGLLRGLSDPRISRAIYAMHAEPGYKWTMAELAKIAALSRSAFFDRFMRTVGTTPMNYLLAWRMAVAKDMLRLQDLSIDEIAARVGYRSASTFCAAFSGHVGKPPRRYVRENATI